MIDGAFQLPDLPREMANESPKGGGWRGVGVVLATAALMIGASDMALRRVSPPKYVREVADALADYEHEDPTTLVLGSSHARTFDVMDRMARERTQGRERILSVPLEAGNFTGYEWVLQHRVEPLIEERDASGAKKRPSLKRLVLVAVWWDACFVDGDPPNFNLPSRAWTFGDFAADVAAHGLNDHNRNYVTTRWLDLWHGSILVSDRGHAQVVEALHDRVKPLSAEAKEKQFQFRLRGWQSIIERGKICGDHPKEVAAADRILKWGQDKGYDVTFMLYPLRPITLSDDTRQNVQVPFQKTMRDVAERRGVRFVDATFDNGGIDDPDFQDFDHLTAAGHEKLSNWLLADKFAFVLDGHVSSPHTTDASGGRP